MIVVIEKYFYSDQEYYTDVRGVFDDIDKAKLEVHKDFLDKAIIRYESADMIAFTSQPLGEDIIIKFKEMKINELCT